MRIVRLTILAAVVTIMVQASTLYGRHIGPRLEAKMERAQAYDRIAVIITLTDRPVISTSNMPARKQRRRFISESLRGNAERSQKPLCKFLRDRGIKHLKSLWMTNKLAAEIPADIIDELAGLEGIEAISLDYSFELPRADYAAETVNQWNLEMIGAVGLWAAGLTGEGVVVAIVDSGVDIEHPDLKDNWRGGSNSWYDVDEQFDIPYDADGHGTQVMGVFAGQAGTGVAPGVRWIAAKVFDDLNQAAISDIHLALQWLLDPDNNPDTDDACDIVCNSWGLRDQAGECVDEFADDIRTLRAAGIAVVFAAGNEGPSPASAASPANYADVLSVGAISDASLIALFSSRGPSACHAGLFPNLVAPGVGIMTTDLSFGGMPNYAVVNGTSFSAPHAAGGLALLLSAFPEAEITNLQAALEQTAVDLGVTGLDFEYGYGGLDVAAAYEFLLATQPQCSGLTIDNRDPGAVAHGTWLVSGGANPWEDDSFYSRTAGDTFEFQGMRSGQDIVSLRWTAWPSRSPAVNIEIWDGDTLLDNTIFIDQTAGANTWVPLGTWTFTGMARIIVVATGGDYSTNADAVRFTPLGAPDVNRIEITGPTLVGDEDPPPDYDIKIIDHSGYSSTTEPHAWDVFNGGASIDSTGRLMAPDVTGDTPVRISAEYVVGDCTYTDTIEVTVFDGATAGEVVVDNLDAAASRTGAWDVSGGAGPWAGDSLWSRAAGDTFTFSADLENVPYAVYLRWTAWPSRRTSVPVEVRMNGQVLDTVIVNQQQNPSQWNLLGIYTLGSTSHVTVRSLGGGSTNADAVRFMPVALLTEVVLDNDTPVAAATGTWETSGGADPYGSRSVWSRGAGDTVTYEVPLTGTFNIQGWWTEWPSRSMAVPIQIYDGGTLLRALNVNQLVNGGRWNGIVEGLVFTDSVRIVVHSTPSANSTNADAFKLVVR